MKRIQEALNEKILILDGPMGTMIQNENLKEEDYRGKKFESTSIPLKGNNDILNLTQEKIIYDIHTKYLAAGADIIETNTFNSTKTSQLDYKCEDFSYDLNFSGGKIARKAVDDFLTKNPKETKYVAGVLGPTNRTCSMSPDVNNPGFRNISFDELYSDYEKSSEALIEAGVDVIMVETIFDTLNAKAALSGIGGACKKSKKNVPIMISATITDLSGRTLSGQTIEAFYNSILHVDPLSVGLNCALGPKELEPYIIELDRISESFISVHPNAGLPNAFGEYDETPDSMANFAKKWSQNGYINIIGGCCGATPDHINLMAQKVRNIKPRKKKTFDPKLRLSGLESFKF
jgi:5-methyltetrahydrofolate--homocysteine methyltransferase